VGPSGKILLSLDIMNLFTVIKPPPPPQKKKKKKRKEKKTQSRF